MSNPILPDCRAIFNDPRLSLVVWERGDLAAHEAGLRFTGAMLDMAALAGSVMPLLRPAGRSCGNMADIRSRANSWKGVGMTWSCELWVQVHGSVGGSLWSAIASKINAGWDAESGRDLGDATYARWEPIGNPSPGNSAGQYLPNPGSLEQRIYAALGEPEKAALLKLVWWRGVVALMTECVQLQGIRRFDPCADRDAVADLLELMLQPMRLADFGIGKATDVVDPSRFGASHLACFSLNAFLEPGADLDHAYNDCRATRPNRCNDLPHYIAGIRTGRW